MLNFMIRIFFGLLIFLSYSAFGQYPDSLLVGDPSVRIDSSSYDSVFDNLENAFLTPDKVIALDLNNESDLRSIETFDFNINQFKNLKWFSIGNNHQLNRALPEPFYRFETLIFLSLVGNDSLKLSACDILNMNSLREIWLNSQMNQIEDSIQENKHLTFLFIVNCNLNTLPTSFSNLKSLRGIYAMSNNFETIPKCIFTLSNLEVLNFGDCPINYIDPNQFKKLTKLKRLILANTKLSEKNIQAITKNLPTNCVFISKRFND